MSIQPQQSPTDRFYAALDKAVDADKKSGKTDNTSLTSQLKITPRSPPPELTEFKGKSIKEKMNDISNLSLSIRFPETDASSSSSLKGGKTAGNEVRRAVHDLIDTVSEDHRGAIKFGDRTKILESTDEGAKARVFSMGKGSIRAHDISYKVDVDKEDQTKMGNTEKTYHSFLNDLFEQLKNAPSINPENR